VTLPGDPTEDPGSPTDGFDVTSGPDTDIETSDSDTPDPLKSVREISGGHGESVLTAGVGNSDFSVSTFGLSSKTVMLDETDDSQRKNRPQKFLYDGVLDGFEFQGFGMKAAGINQDMLWQALDDMQRQMSGLDESSNRSFLVSSIMGGSSLLLTTGLISWVLRGGALASTLLSTLPLWRGMDPLPLLAGRKKKKKKDAITDTQVMDRSEDLGHSREAKDAERMFEDSTKRTDDSRGAERRS